MPSAYSLSDGTERVPEADLICISFKKHIIHWLEQCRNVRREEMKPLLTQFLDTIRTITGITRENMTDMIAQEIAGSADSLRAAMQIADSESYESRSVRLVGSLVVSSHRFSQRKPGSTGF